MTHRSVSKKRSSPARRPGSTPSRVRTSRRARSSRRPEETLAFIGAGRVASALAVRLAEEGWRIATVASPHLATARDLARRTGARLATTDPARAARSGEALLLAVSDRAIPVLASQLARMTWPDDRTPPIVLHTSGAGGAEWLAPLADRGWPVGSLHPLIAFPPVGHPPPDLRGATFAIDGDARARSLARRIAASLGGRTLSLPGSARIRYHLAACLASNYVVALVAEAVALLAEDPGRGSAARDQGPGDRGAGGSRATISRVSKVRVSPAASVARATGPLRGATKEPLGDATAWKGVSRARALAALIPLLRSTLANLETIGLPDALTGPVARGDAATVALHAGLIETRSAELRQLHRSLVLSALRLASSTGRMDARTARKLRAALGPPLRR